MRRPDQEQEAEEKLFGTAYAGFNNQISLGAKAYNIGATSYDPDLLKLQEPSHYKGRGPKSYRRSDERILEEVCERMTDAPDLNASTMEVEVKDAEVFIRGTASSRSEKRRAESIVEGVKGVRDVHNQLRLAP